MSAVNLLDEATRLLTTPASILVGALGVAKTEGLKSGISAAGIVVAVLWIVSGDALNALRAGQSLALLPAMFLLIWIVSLAIHLPKHLQYRQNLRASRGEKKKGRFIELDPKIACLFSQEEVNQILLAYSPLKLAATESASKASAPAGR